MSSFRSLAGGACGGEELSVPLASSGPAEVRLAGVENKEKMYEPKQRKKLVRVLTVVAYVFFVSLAAIMLSLYYVFLWDPSPNPRQQQQTQQRLKQQLQVLQQQQRRIKELQEQLYQQKLLRQQQEELMLQQKQHQQQQQHLHLLQQMWSSTPPPDYSDATENLDVDLEAFSEEPLLQQLRPTEALSAILERPTHGFGMHLGRGREGREPPEGNDIPPVRKKSHDGLRHSGGLSENSVRRRAGT